MIYNKYFENILPENIFKNSKVFKILNYKNMIFSILALFLTSLPFVNDSHPFGYAILGVASLFNIPLIIILIATILGILIFQMPSVYIVSFLIFFVVFTFVTAAIKIEGVSKKASVMIKLLSSVLISQIISFILKISIDKDLFTAIYTILSVLIFYLIFTTGIYVVINHRKNFVFSKEEYLAAMTMFTLLIASLQVIKIQDFSIVNLLCLMLVLIYAWKNGAINGSSLGLIVGLLVSIITNSNILVVLVYTFTGYVVGFLSKYGKIVTILGFVVGTLAINYWINGAFASYIKVVEIVFAGSLVLILPKKIELKLERFFNKNIALSKPYEYVLDYASSVKNKLNAVSDVFENLSKIKMDLTEENCRENREVIKKYITDFVENNCLGCKDKKSCLNGETIDSFTNRIATKLENNDDISSINFYINCDNNNKIMKDITEIYNSMKLMRMLKQKQEKNNEKLSNQYKEVSNIIKKVSENIKNVPVKKNKNHEKLREELKLNGYVVYEDDYADSSEFVEYTFITDILTDIDQQKHEIAEITSNILERNMVIKLILNSSKNEKSKIRLAEKVKYDLDIAITSLGKSDEEVIGDSYISMELDDFNHIVALSDGAGSGPNAQKSSQIIISMLEKLLNGGFDNAKAIEIINNVIKLKNSDSNFATLDVFICNLRTADSQFIKLGAAPSYVVEKNKVTTINSIGIPLGLVEDNNQIPIAKKLNNDSIVVQVTDGVITENMDVINNYFTRHLQIIDTSKNSKVLSEELMKLVIKENNNVLKDDATISVIKVKEN